MTDDKNVKFLPVYVSDFMVTPVFTIHLQMKLWEVAELFVAKQISGAPVVDGMDRVLSVMGEGVILRLAASEGLDATIAHCLPQLTPIQQIFTIKPTDTFTDVYRLFLRHPIHRLPVTDANGKLVGIVARSMILRIFVEAHYGKALPPRKP